MSNTLPAVASMLNTSLSQSVEKKLTVNEGNTDNAYLSIIILIHIFIIIIAIIGNSIVIYLAIFNIRLRNVRNAFMVNLTFSNLLLATICTPWFLLTLVYPSLTLSETWCKLSNSIPIVIILVSAFSIMMIAIDRWMFVVFSRSRQLKRQDATIIIILIWIFAILLAAPMYHNRHQIVSMRQDLLDAIKRFKFTSNNLFNSPENGTFSTNQTDLNVLLATNLTDSHLFMDSSSIVMAMENYSLPAFPDTKYCVENWKNPSHKRVYILILFCLEFVLPCLCMLITYIWIIRFLKVQNDRMSHYEMLRKKLIQKERPHRKNCKLLSSLCLAFIVCCLPLSLFNIVTNFISTSEKQNVIYWPLTILTTLELLNTVLSPLLYGWMNHNFRIEINEKLRKLKYRRTPNSFVRNENELAKMPLKCYGSEN